MIQAKKIIFSIFRKRYSIKIHKTNPHFLKFYVLRYISIVIIFFLKIIGKVYSKFLSFEKIMNGYYSIFRDHKICKK